MNKNDGRVSQGGGHKNAESVPGTNWRFLAHVDQRTLKIENQGVFDELVVDNWLHIEQMDNGLWWMRVGDARIMVEVNKDGSASVDVERGFYDQPGGINHPG